MKECDRCKKVLITTKLDLIINSSKLETYLCITECMPGFVELFKNYMKEGE